MSEYTEGFLFLNSHVNSAKLITEREVGRVYNYTIYKINNKWSSVLVENIDLRISRLLQWVQEMSEHFPVLYFNHASDHGWGFTLFDSGKEVSKVGIHYELEWHMVYELLEDEFPDLAGMTHALFDRDNIQDYYKRVRESKEYQDAIDEMYINLNAETFSVFGVSDAEIERLKSEIISDGYWNQMFKQVYTFLEILDLKEMDWVSYRYIKRQQDEDE